LKLLLDTHTLIWWGLDDPRLGAAARDAIGAADNEIFVSAASAMEIATKHRLGKLPQAERLARDFETMVAAMGFQPLSITIAHAQFAGNLVVPHKDPFDRLLMAQAILEGMPLASNEAVFDGFGVRRVW
jgi:PIN domain nuclease of toxin-antitoxin system